MERLTEYDKVRGCYVIKPDVPQGQHIQRLGKYEDMDEHLALTAKIICGHWIILENASLRMCSACGHVTCTSGTDKAQVFPAEWNFCPNCGADMRGVEE